MSDADAESRYAPPAEDRSAQEGSIGLLVLLALGLAITAISLAMLSHEEAEPFVLTILAGLSVIGVFSLFAGAVGILRFGEPKGGSDIAKSLLDNFSDGALITKTDGTVLYANDAYRRLIGEDEDGGVLTVKQAFAGDVRLAEPIFRLSKAARQRRAWTEDFPLTQEEGDVAARWYRVSVRQIPASPKPGRQTMLTAWQVSDISADRRRDEATLEKCHEIIDFLDAAPVGLLSVDGKGRIDYLNATLAQWLDLDQAAAAGGDLKLKNLAAKESVSLLLRPGSGTSPAQNRPLDIDLRKQGGGSLPVRILHGGRPTGEGDGRLTHMLVLNRLQTGDAKDVAATAEVRFSRLFHKAPIAIATVDARGRIGSMNPKFVEVFGDTGKPIHEGETGMGELLGAPAAAEIAGAIESAKSDPRVELEVAFGDDERRHARFIVSSLEQVEDEQDAAIVYAVETTEQRALEMQIAQSQKMQAIGQLAGGIAHDFNNVLTAIIGFSELLLASHRPADPAFQDIMNIKNNANRAAGLVRQLLAFSRQQTLRPQILSLGEVLGDLKILLDHLLGEKIKLTVEHGQDLWLIKADLHQFEQVILNLAVNARDAMPEGGELVIRTANVPEAESARLDYPGLVAGDYVMCMVSDTGHGMPASVLEKIFDPFFSTKDVGKGTGLGLSTVFGIVKQSDGYIYPESEEGKGTSFRIYLPRQAEPEAKDSASLADGGGAADAKKDLTGSGTVLLVEDEEAVRSFAVRALMSRGYTVLEAATGSEALEVMEEHGGEVDLVVSDVVMPEMDGPTLLKKLRERHTGLKVIFVSGYAEDAFKKNLEGQDDFAFLPKPFSLKQLAEAVKNALEG